MKTCSKCGAEIKEGSSCCPACGAKWEDAENQESLLLPETSTSILMDKYPLRWHRFMMVAMIIGAILTILSGILTVTGYQYFTSGVEASRVYDVYPGLRGCDIAYGVAMIAIGIFQIFVRNRLNSFSRSGIPSMVVLYIVSIASTVVYLLVAGSVSRLNLFDSSAVASLILSAAFLIINCIYYFKRRELFY